jgi:hypothetical protein
MGGGGELGPGHHLSTFKTNVNEGQLPGTRVRGHTIPFLCFHIKYNPSSDVVGYPSEAEFGVKGDLVLMVHGVVGEEFEKGVSVELNPALGH